MLHFDPCALLHGVFISKKEFLQGRLRLPRILTGFVEARDVRDAPSGGVKNSYFDPSGEVQAEDYPKDVYSNVPYSRLEFTASDIRAYFNLDLAQLRGYRLPEEAQRLLVGVALFKVRRFLDRGLRLRTACDLVLKDDLRATEPSAFSVPSTKDLAATLPGLIKAAQQVKGLLRSSVLELETNTVSKKKATTEGDAVSDAEGDE